MPSHSPGPPLPQGYYRRTADYFPTKNRQRRGCFRVPMVHSTFLVSLRAEGTAHLAFYPPHPHYTWPCDDIIVFDENDLVVDGGGGIDFLIGEGSVNALLAGTGTISGNPTIEVAIESTLNLTSMSDLANELGINVNDGKIVESQLDDNWVFMADRGDYAEFIHYTDESNTETDAHMIVSKTALENNS